MKVVFRVDASLKIGSGHVMRCLGLAHMLKENGANIRFICRKHKGNLIDKIRSNGFIVYDLELLNEDKIDNVLAHSKWLGSTQKKDADECIEILKKEKFNWIIVDHYAIDLYWEERLKPYFEKMMVIDDLADRHHSCDILLDQTFGRQKDEYFKLTPSNCKLLIGSRFALLRPEFSKWRHYSIERRKKTEFKEFLVFMGGVDLDNTTERILDVLKKCDLPKDIKISIIMGLHSPHLASIQSKALEMPYSVDIMEDVSNMAEIMANADIAIGAAGFSSWERCCLGLPTIQIVTAVNQETIAVNLESSNAVKLVKDLNEIQSIVDSYSKWMREISESASKITDGLGLNRVYNSIINQ